MMGNENSNKSISKGYCWHWMCRGRKSSVFWGIFFIVVGFFWFGKKADWFSPELITIFWPVVLVVIGIWIIGVTLIKKGASYDKFSE
jgi:Domain of unknown function (DUF5668)